MAGPHGWTYLAPMSSPSSTTTEGASSTEAILISLTLRFPANFSAIVADPRVVPCAFIGSDGPSSFHPYYLDICDPNIGDN
ncbi:hypothetical protein OGATHE_000432 [Ogataea polymorpha]|uniref:Uncharacterized protein n=1 Tax=Ogataea polymorpha TaxID=460523 RepID=A0A9P8TFL7_9ASCO|nr:hypothetical protein OGATHE_000432 [Ogataea polymorpha]